MSVLVLCLGWLTSLANAATLSVRAENDYNTGLLPVQIAVFADDVFQGTLTFGQLVDTFTVESIEIPDGTAVVALNNLNDYFDADSPFSDAVDLNAYIDWIEIRGFRLEAEAFSRTSGDDGIGVDEIITDYNGTGATVVNLWQTNDRLEFDLDVTPPTIVSASLSTDTLWSPNHKMVEVNVYVDAEDDFDTEVDCLIVGVTSNEPAAGPGNNAHEPDWEITDDLTVWLRAERNGNGQGRIYTLEVACFDNWGNVTPLYLEVLVPHNQGKKNK
jgi:hypothetical protein